MRPRDECPPKESRWPKREFQKRKLSVRRIVNIVWWVVVTVAFLLAELAVGYLLGYYLLGETVYL